MCARATPTRKTHIVGLEQRQTTHSCQRTIKWWENFAPCNGLSQLSVSGGFSACQINYWQRGAICLVIAFHSQASQKNQKTKMGIVLIRAWWPASKVQCNITTSTTQNLRVHASRPPLIVVSRAEPFHAIWWDGSRQSRATVNFRWSWGLAHHKTTGQRQKRSWSLRSCWSAARFLKKTFIYRLFSMQHLSKRTRVA